MNLEELNKYLDEKIVYITEIKGLEKDSEKVSLSLTSGICNIDFLHYQDCCEEVRLIDFEDYRNSHNSESPMLLGIEMSTSTASTGDLVLAEYGLWTFYTIKTSHGDIWMRWLGESNGYYSEEVSIEITKKITIDRGR